MKLAPYISLFLSLLIAVPSLVCAQTNTQTTAQDYQYQTNGTYGCNKTGAAASSVAVFAASGAYVPVSDAAVELNTGYLVYLNCSLRPLVSALSQSATAGMASKILNSYNKDNNGNPYFSVNRDNENSAARDKAVIPAISYIAAATGPTFQNQIQATLAQTYAANTRNAAGALRCPYNSSQTNSNIWINLASIGTPSCDELIDYELANEQLGAIGANAVQNNDMLILEGQGTYPITTTDSFGNTNIVTPGAIVLNQAQQALQAGLLKTENAQDIGQMVSSLFAGIGAQALSSAQGLSGLTQSSQGIPSYIDQVAAQAAQGVITGAVNAAITELNGVLTTVNNYKNSLESIANTLLSAINNLKGAQDQCWQNIISKVCAGGTVTYTAGVATCVEIPLGGATSTPAITLQVATSSSYNFAGAFITAQIQPLGTQTAANIKSINSTIDAINALVAGITNSASQSAQAAALQQLDKLTASDSFPTTADMAKASQQATSISTSMQQLITQTVNNWVGNTGQTDAYGGAINQTWDSTVSATTIGWCNYNDTKTLQMWEVVWKK